MKKEYTKPELNTKAFAQFENVFTACGKTKHDGCGWALDEPGSPNCAYEGLTGPGSN
jgi:hypothetical protein